MATKITMEFKKGDNVNHAFKMAIADYTTGGALYFTAKPAVDNDATDATAVIDKAFTDSVVTTDATYATWSLAFVPADITGVNFSNGERKLTYLGEFQFVSATGVVSTFPSDDNFIEVIIYADIRRSVS